MQADPTSGKTVAILQSNYVPWKGYFDLMRVADELILYDDVQYTRRDWRNRNLYKSPAGVRWLTIPVQVKGRYHQRIDETLVSDSGWAERHWTTLVGWYSRAPFFARYEPVLEGLYRNARDRHLAQINRRFLDALKGLLGIATPLTSSSDYGGTGHRTDRLVDLCTAAGASRYLTGPSARSYLEEARFRAAGIEVVWMSYAGYREYPQLYPPFDHHVSVLDLLFSVGEQAPRYMLGAS